MSVTVAAQTRTSWWHFGVRLLDSGTFPITPRPFMHQRLLSKTGYVLSSEGKQWPSKCSVISEQKRRPLLIDVESHRAAWTNSVSCKLSNRMQPATVPSLCNRSEQGITGTTPTVTHFLSPSNYKIVGSLPSMFPANHLKMSLQSNMACR